MVLNTFLDISFLQLHLSFRLQVSQSIMALLGKLQPLRQVHLGNLWYTPFGPSKIEPDSKLEEVTLSRVKSASFPGVRAMLAALAKFKCLKALGLYDCTVRDCSQVPAMLATHEEKSMKFFQACKTHSLSLLFFF